MATVARFCWRPQGDSNPCYRRERAGIPQGYQVAAAADAKSVLRSQVRALVGEPNSSSCARARVAPCARIFTSGENFRRFALLTLCVLALPAQAGDWRRLDLGPFLAGFASPLMAHETGHQIVGGEDIKWHGAKWRCVRPCNAARISAGGFVSEIAFTEFSNRFIESASFNKGANLSTALHTLSYAARSGGDTANFTPTDRRRMRALLLVSSIYFFVKIDF